MSHNDTTKFLVPKNWESFQHYKDRNPPWIKLHHQLLENFEFFRLQVASRALLPCLWLLASEYPSGRIPADLPMVAFRLRMTDADFEAALNPIIEAGFFDICEPGASKALARRKPRATPETETETETETEYGAARAGPVAAVPLHTPVSLVEDSRPSDQESRLAAPPVKARGDYAFECGVIRLNVVDLMRWKKAFPHIDVEAELVGMAPWAAERGKSWFSAVSTFLAKKNREAGERAQERKVQNGGRMYDPML